MWSCGAITTRVAWLTVAAGTLIEGESLLNDGSAVVLYVVLKNWIDHTNSNELTVEAQLAYPGGWVDLVRIVAQMLLFGIAYGVATAFVVCVGLKKVYNDALVETALCLGGAYLVFWTAEIMLGSSAVIAVVVFGFCARHAPAPRTDVTKRRRAPTPRGARQRQRQRRPSPSALARRHLTAAAPSRRHQPPPHRGHLARGAARHAHLLRIDCVDAQHDHLLHRRL